MVRKALLVAARAQARGVRTGFLFEHASRGAICPSQQRKNLRRLRIGRAPAAVASARELL